MEYVADEKNMDESWMWELSTSDIFLKNYNISLLEFCKKKNHNKIDEC